MRFGTGSLRPLSIFLSRRWLLVVTIAVASFCVPRPLSCQVWVSSGFQTSSDSSQVTAYCSTSAVDPKTGAVTRAASDYSLLYAVCDVTSSTGQTISNTTTCPTYFTEGSGAFSFRGPGVGGNPTGLCTLPFQPQRGVTYTVNAVHYLWTFQTTVDLDPEGFEVDPLLAPPAYTTEADSITQELEGSGVSQTFQEFQIDQTILLASSSAQFPGLVVQVQNVTPTLNLKPEQAKVETSRGPTAHLTLGGTFQIALGTNGANGKFTAQQSTFQLGAASLSGDLDQNALFPGNTVLLYANRVDNAVVLQAVHLGTQQLRIIPTNTSIKPVNITLSVEQPGSLGSSHSDLDSLLFPLADQTGVPAQMIKGQVKTEGGFNPMAWRYEPVNASVGDFAISGGSGDLRAQTPYKALNLPTIGDENDPGDCGTKYDYAAHVDSRLPDPRCEGLAEGGTFSQQVMEDLVQASPAIMIPERDPTTGRLSSSQNGQPILRPLDPADRYVSVRDLLSFNPRQRWAQNGNPGRVTEVSNGTVDFSAQFTLASSYGLLQVMYATAIDQGSRGGHWAGNFASCGPTNPIDPDNLFDTQCNLASGGGSLGIGTRLTEMNFESAHGANALVTDESELELFFLDAYQHYDPGKAGYGGTVIANTRAFEPNPSGTIFTSGGQQ